MKEKALALMVLMVLLLSLAPAPSDAALGAGACSEGRPLALYFGPEGKMLPAAIMTEASVPFPSQAKVSVLFAWLVGTWNSPPLGKPLLLSQPVNVTLYARSSGGPQFSTRFQIYLGVNDQRLGGAVSTNTDRLGSEPKEFKAIYDTGFNLQLNPGDTLGIWVYVTERGSGGELVYGGGYLSRIEIGLEALSLNFTTTQRAGEVRMEGNATDLWGSSDISSLTLAVLGPFSEEDDTLCGLELVSNKTKVAKLVTEEMMTTSDDETGAGVLFSYTWKYDSAKIASGQYMTVAIVETSSGLTVDRSAWVTLSRTKAGFLFGDSPALLGAVLLLAAGGAGGGLYYLHRKGRLADLLANRKSTAAFMIVLLGTVAVAGLYLTLMPTQAGSTDAPDFRLRDVDGRTVTLSGFRGQVVVLDMMATWCPTCNQEIPELSRFHAANPDVVIISIDIDLKETDQELKSHMQSKGASWIYCRDDGSVLRNYRVTEIPKIVVVTPQGKLTFMKSGLVRADELGSVARAAKSGSAPLLALGGEMGLPLMAFVAGVTAFFSPCAFPLLPGYMTYYLGRKEDALEALPRREVLRKAVLGGIAAAIGILMVYLLMGLLVAAAGEAVKPAAALLAPVVAAVILAMGIVMLTRYEIPLYRLTALFRPAAEAGKKAVRKLAGREVALEGHAGLAAYGAGYGMASLGCHAPIFITVISLALLSGGFASGVVAFIMYGLGMGVLMVAVTVLVGMAKTQAVKNLQHQMPLIKKITGVVLAVVGAYLLYYYLVVVPVY